MVISPQGYKLGGAPEAQNPFWGEGEDQSVDKIYATASVDNQTGVPSVVTSKRVSGNDITFDFAFHNLKGEKGAAGKDGGQGPQGLPGKDGKDGGQGPQGEPGFSPSANVEQTETGATITITDQAGTTSAEIKNGGTGPVGPAGPGVPRGGTAGQVLSKVDDTDYNTEWKDAGGGGNIEIEENVFSLALGSGTLGSGKALSLKIPLSKEYSESKYHPIIDSLRIVTSQDDMAYLTSAIACVSGSKMLTRRGYFYGVHVQVSNFKATDQSLSGWYVKGNVHFIKKA